METSVNQAGTPPSRSFNEATLKDVKTKRLSYAPIIQRWLQWNYIHLNVETYLGLDAVMLLAVASIEPHSTKPQGTTVVGNLGNHN